MQSFYVIGGIVFSLPRVVCAAVSEARDHAYLWLEGRTEPLSFTGAQRVSQLLAVLDPADAERLAQSQTVDSAARASELLVVRRPPRRPAQPSPQ
jgi:hypothetical protein